MAADHRHVEPSPDFRLERVRALRERAEDLAREAYAESLRHQARGRALVRAAEERLLGAQHAQRSLAAAGSVGAAELRLLQGFRERTERARLDALRDQHERDTHLAGRRAALTAASRDREALEKLKAKHAAAWTLHERRLDAAVTDELALNQHRRRSDAA